MEALQKGYVDAIIASEPQGALALDAGYREVVDLADYPFPVAGSAIVVDHTWLKENPDADRRFVKGAIDAIALLKHDKQAAFRALTTWPDVRHESNG